MVKVRPLETPEIHKVLQGESLVQNSVGYMHMVRSHTIFSRGLFVRARRRG